MTGPSPALPDLPPRRTCPQGHAILAGWLGSAFGRCWGQGGGRVQVLEEGVRMERLMGPGQDPVCFFMPVFLV